MLLDRGLVGGSLRAAGTAVAACPARARLLQRVVRVILLRCGRHRPLLPASFSFPLFPVPFGLGGLARSLFRLTPGRLPCRHFRRRFRRWSGLAQVGEGRGKAVQGKGRLRLLLLCVLHEGQDYLLPAKGQDSSGPGRIAVVLLRFCRRWRLGLRCLPGGSQLIVMQVGSVRSRGDVG